MWRIQVRSKHALHIVELHNFHIVTASNASQSLKEPIKKLAKEYATVMHTSECKPSTPMVDTVPAAAMPPAATVDTVTRKRPGAPLMKVVCKRPARA